jgi:hypothetical protein
VKCSFLDLENNNVLILQFEKTKNHQKIISKEISRWCKYWEWRKLRMERTGQEGFSFSRRLMVDCARFLGFSCERIKSGGVSKHILFPSVGFGGYTINW